MMYLEKKTTRSSERGVALLIAIFALLLISGVAITMITTSGTESALNANYRRNTASFLAAKSGIEEARERLVPCAPDSLWPATACANPPVSADPLFSFNPPTVVGQALYIVNAGAADPAINPLNPGNQTFYDFQYAMEFGSAALQPGSRVVNSSDMMRATAAGLAPLNYKWIRINLKSEQMGGIDLDGSGAASDQVRPVRAQSTDVQCLTGTPNCTSDPNATITTAPVFRITAMALDPSGAERVVQAEVALPPVFNPNGAISSQAGVDINGNFNAFGAWPPIVEGRCGGKVIKTCGGFDGKSTTPDCTQPYDAGADTCAGKPRLHKDYCGVGEPVNSVASASDIKSGPSYSKVPDATSSCTPSGSGCISTVDPQMALSPNTPNWPYDMDEIINLFRPPNTEPIEQVVQPTSALNCSTFDTNGNRSCRASGASLGTLPSPWPVQAGVTSTNEQAKLTFAEVGPGGLLKLTAGSSGAGILVVEGDLVLEAGFQWYGLIIVRGTVDFLGGGSTPTNVVGGIIAGKSVTNASATTDVGGSVNITYSSCAYRKFNQDQPLRYLGFREIARPPQP